MIRTDIVTALAIDTHSCLNIHQVPWDPIPFSDLFHICDAHTFMQEYTHSKTHTCTYVCACTNIDNFMYLSKNQITE